MAVADAVKQWIEGGSDDPCIGSGEKMREGFNCLAEVSLSKSPKGSYNYNALWVPLGRSIGKLNASTQPEP